MFFLLNVTSVEKELWLIFIIISAQTAARKWMEEWTCERRMTMRLDYKAEIGGNYDLASCPWCGRKPRFHTTSYGSGDFRTIRFDLGCDHCSVYAPSHGKVWEISISLMNDGTLSINKDMREEAVSAWNQRMKTGEKI